MAQSDQARQNGMIISATVLTGLSTLVVLTRLIVRVGIIRKPGWDDLTIFCALLCTIGYLVILFIARENRIGFPVFTLTLDNIISILKGTLAIQVLYYTIVTFVKSSILFMYLRFAASTWFRRAAIWTIAFHAGFWVICVSTTLGQCRPLHKMWDDLKAPVEGTCINTTAFFYFTSGFNIITDIWILAMPIKALSSINRPQKEKIALIAIFGVGLFATITSIIRLHTIYKYTEAIDPIQQALSVNVWSMIEVNVGIICASVPALKPLFTPDKLRSAAHGSSPKYPSSSPFSSKSRSGYVGSKGHDRVEEGLKEDSNNSIPLPRMGTTTTAQAAGMRSYESTERILQR